MTTQNYSVAPDTVPIFVQEAIDWLSKKIKNENVLMTPDSVKQYLRLKIGNYEHEVFGVLFLDAQNRLIEFEEMFRGTLSQTSVYPREILKAALFKNAASVILAHNHPSGETGPSHADEHLTLTLKSSLALIDVRVLDHVIVASSGATSMAEIGLL